MDTSTLKDDSSSTSVDKKDDSASAFKCDTINSNKQGVHDSLTTSGSDKQSQSHSNSEQINIDSNCESRIGINY